MPWKGAQETVESDQPLRKGTGGRDQQKGNFLPPVHPEMLSKNCLYQKDKF